MQEFWSWWQHLPQHISPVIFQIGAFKLQYYGLMYIVAFAITYGLVMYRLKRESRFHVSGEQVNDLTTTIILGLMIGARLGGLAGSSGAACVGVLPPSKSGSRSVSEALSCICRASAEPLSVRARSVSISSTNKPRIKCASDCCVRSGDAGYKKSSRSAWSSRASW